MTGLLSPLDYDLEPTIDIELRNRQQIVIRANDNIAAHGIAFSQQLSSNLHLALQVNNAKLADLNNNPELLSNIQNMLYDTVHDYMQQTTCSGAFFLLNASVNTAQEQPTKTGLYLKYANLYSENTLQNDICMFRGHYDVARRNNINLYSTWQMEWNLARLKQGKELLYKSGTPLQESYHITPVLELVDSWEKARLFILPIYDENQNAIGFCGFEFSNIFFKLQTPLATYHDTPLITAFLDVDDNDTYSGQLSDEETLGDWPLVASRGSKYITFTSSGNTYIGKMLPVKTGTSVHYLAIMLPESSYNELMKESSRKAIATFVVILMLFSIAGYLLNKKYVEPIVSDLEQLKLGPSSKPTSQLQEFDEVFSSWRSRDYQHKEKLLSMEQERAYAQQEYADAVENLHNITAQQQSLQQQYDELQATLREQSRKLEERLTALQQEKEAAERQYASTQAVLKGYLDKENPPVDKDIYELFEANLPTLTSKEKEIFDLYLAGLVPKEITAKLNISENTIKYHNKNIYSKLCVKNRKELLQCIKYMQSKKEC